MQRFKNLATHVLYLVFRCNWLPVCFSHFPSTTASGHELYPLLWKSVNTLFNSTFLLLQVIIQSVYDHIMQNLTEVGKEVIEDVHPWIVNVLVDWANFDQIICTSPKDGLFLTRALG